MLQRRLAEETERLEESRQEAVARVQMLESQFIQSKRRSLREITTLKQVKRGNNDSYAGEEGDNDS